MKPRVLLVKNKKEGFNTAKKLIYKLSNPKTLLFLSGGSTPSFLYRNLVKEKKLKAGAVAMVDERFGKKLHSSSNEKMIKDTGLTEFLKKQKIPFYPILKNKSISLTSKEYEKIVSKQFIIYKNKIAILGVGEDGHIAGLPAGIFNSQSKIFKGLVLEIDNFPGKFPKRITLTFNALEKFDALIVIVLGIEKKKALKLLFKKGKIEQIPARFLLGKQIAEKTILITDQKI